MNIGDICSYSSLMELLRWRGVPFSNFCSHLHCQYWILNVDGFHAARRKLFNSVTAFNLLLSSFLTGRYPIFYVLHRFLIILLFWNNKFPVKKSIFNLAIICTTHKKCNWLHFSGIFYKILRQTVFVALILI